MVKGWYYEGYRHSLAAKGIKTSFSSISQIREARRATEFQRRISEAIGQPEKKVEVPVPVEISKYEDWLESHKDLSDENIAEFMSYDFPKLSEQQIEDIVRKFRGKTSLAGKEIKRIDKPMSRREYLYNDIQFLKGVIENPPEDLPSERLKDMVLELEGKESEYKSLTSPRRLIHVGEMYEIKPWEERYKGTRGRKPEFIGDLPLQIDLMKSPQEKHKDYLEQLKESSEERAEDIALERIEANILREPKLAEDELMGPEVVAKIRMGKKSLEKPELYPELNYAAKRVFKKGKYHATLSGPEVKRLASEVQSKLRPLAKKIEIAGSIRRKSETEPVDVDIVMIPRDKEEVRNKLADLGRITRSGKDMVETKIKGVDVDVYFTEPKSYGASLLTYTGSFGHNIGLRQIARKQRKILNQRGIFDRNKGTYLAGRTEREIYKELERPRFKPPEERQ